MNKEKAIRELASFERRAERYRKSLGFIPSDVAADVEEARKLAHGE